MKNKIYVGNLSYDTREAQLEKMFSAYGNVLSATIIMDKYTDRSKGFGFVEMETEEAANAAISALNGKELDNRQLRVNIAQDKKPQNRTY